ncbi:MAG TPA: gluconate 2-dehydrogenase subunit 3 family protein [Chloroflexota bacterium]|nr:gluconate 2-dehydrogenase subunit 3 family protein [Chloroflexota bacterium]
MSERQTGDPIADPTYDLKTGRRPIERPIVDYPGYHVLDQQENWDEATRRVVLDRVYQVPPIRFFDQHELETLQALADRILPQTDRSESERIPIAPWIDHRCYHHIIDGWRFDNMPPDHDAWRLGLHGIDEVSSRRYDRQFVALGPVEQDKVVRTIADGQPPGDTWQRLPARRFWVYIVLRQIVSVYYAHPTAWDEIGFGGPAYPRGYFALSHGYPEPWEVREVRPNETTD